MDINNNTNISSMISQSLSKLNLNSVNRSFKVSQKEGNNVNIKEGEADKNLDLVLNEEKIPNLEEVKKKSGIDVKEIQQYASMVGENLTIEDINYGLMYGRSVIADYSA